MSVRCRSHAPGPLWGDPVPLVEAALRQTEFPSSLIFENLPDLADAFPSIWACIGFQLDVAMLDPHVESGPFSLPLTTMMGDHMSGCGLGCVARSAK